MPSKPLELKYYPDPILRTKCKPCTLNPEERMEVAKEMNKVMVAYGGMGLAAPQVGLDMRLFIMKYPRDGSDFVMFSNPEIIKHSHSKPLDFEGCLSLCGVKTKVKRWEWIEIEFDDPYSLGNRTLWYETGLVDRVIQHEIDHLDGILIHDYIESKLVQKMFLEKYYKAKKMAGRRAKL